jgi:hypothetical protein
LGEAVETDELGVEPDEDDEQDGPEQCRIERQWIEVPRADLGVGE